ncbi:purine-binding chemotaxis protein CheW [Ekhidna lutea]|uniref:Purine-binding chemotaxis protein CheW n=1 Tax=Ekhidna lutea TaxID=447679 RepID=A0A239H1T6_EKHLU|nr:chemotaxis protein CheW [Ekhidna lutea]SNS75357.1 purine-binding chemotaxis protein CheW [Ekhidna lutea]
MALGKNLTKKTSEITAEEKAEKGKQNQNESIQEGERDEELGLQARLHQFCVFKSGGEEYAIPIQLVSEVVKCPRVSLLPEMPPYISGMVNVRGNIYGILDLATFFNPHNHSNDKTYNYLLVLEHEEYKMGIAIPEVPDTLMVAEKMIEELSASRLKSVTGQKYLKGIIKKDRRMIILFDILGMITGDQFTQTA